MEQRIILNMWVLPQWKSYFFNAILIGRLAIDFKEGYIVHRTAQKLFRESKYFTKTQMLLSCGFTISIKVILYKMPSFQFY